MKDIEFLEFTLQQEEIFNQIRPLYETAFGPKKGEGSWNQFLNDLEDYPPEEKERVNVFGAVQGGKTLLGFCVSKFLKEFTYVPYLTVKKRDRGGGIGLRLAEMCIDLARRDADEFNVADSLLLFEIEKPELATNKRERIEREARVKFFLKINSIFLDVEYIEPKFGEDTPSYLLMIRLSGENFINAERLIRYVGTLYWNEARIPRSLQLKYLKILKKSIGTRKKIFDIPECHLSF